MAEKTGKTLPEWLKVVAATPFEKHGPIPKYLKSEQGMTHGFASLVTLRRLSAAETSSGDAIEAQYAGDKANLLPIYQSITDFVLSLGDDAEISPKKVNVSLRRSKQFALVQPLTKTRLDLGINLKGVEPQGRLEASGSFDSMVSHRVRLAQATDFDEKVQAWLTQAYQNA
jgi:hypothetical protein